MLLVAVCLDTVFKQYGHCAVPCNKQILSVFVWIMGLPSHQLRQERPNSPVVYVRHRPETTLLYQIVQEYWPEFQAELSSHGKTLPTYVTKEFDEYLKCGRLEHDF